MKKLMFSALALCAASAFAVVESDNIVGYATGTARSGNKIMGAQFAAVSGTAIDLTAVTVTGYDKTAGSEAEVSVQSLDYLGKGGMNYSFYDLPSDGIVGWYDGNDEPVTEGSVVLAPGEGLWVNAPSEAYGLQTAGQVPTATYAITLRSGNKMVVNSTPASVDLADIAVSGYDKTAGSEAEVSVQSLDYLGKGGMNYSFYDLPSDGIFGWYDGNDEPVTEGSVMIAPGEGLWVNAPSTSYSLELPGVTL